MTNWAVWLSVAACEPDPGRTPPTTTGGQALVEVDAINGDTVWSGAYRVRGELVVPAGSRLTLLQGTRVLFTEGAMLTVYGVLRAEGTAAQRIVMTADPATPWVPDFHPLLPEGLPHWGGVQFVDARTPDNLLSHVDIDQAQSEFGSVGLQRSEAVLEHLQITGTRLRMVYTDASSVIVRDSVFPTMLAEQDSALSLGLNNDSEYIKGVGFIPPGGHYIVQGNVFGGSKGHNDVIDINSNRWPGPILEVRDNVFLGGGDEGIDGGGDILLDGNTFYAFRKDADHHGTGDSNCTSTGDELPTLLVATRNVYVGVDHVANLKRDSFGYFEHNTVVGVNPSRPSLPGDDPPRILESSVIRLLIPHPVHPDTGAPRDRAGIGAYIEGSLLVDVPERVFGNPDSNPTFGGRISVLDVRFTMLEDPALLAEVDGIHGRAFDVTVGRPVFVDPTAGDYRLAQGSPGVGAGRHGLDLGAAVPAGATVCCVPASTSDRTLRVTVGGPGIFSFVTSMDGGSWSDEAVIADPRAVAARRSAPLHVGPVTPGVHELRVRGRDFAGVLQAEDAATVLTWTVTP